MPSISGEEPEADVPDILMNHIVDLLNRSDYGVKVQFHLEENLESARTPANVGGHIYLAEEIPELYALNGKFRTAMIFTLAVQMRNVISTNRHGIRRLSKAIVRTLHKNLHVIPKDFPTTVAFQDMRVVAIRHFDREEGKRAMQQVEIDIAVKIHESVVFN